MRLSTKALSFAVIAVAVSMSFRARSSARSTEALTDASAFDAAAWSGEYYVEPEETDSGASPADFDAERDYYLKNPDVSVDEEELDESESRDPPPSPSRMPEPGVSPSPSPFFYFPYSNSPGRAYPWIAPKLPEIMVPPSPVPSPAPSPDAKPQAFMYYNRGTLANGTRLENDGKGFVKVFRERDEATGGRGWGTRTLIALIESVAADFAEQFPGRERLQVADIARQHGGRMIHGSHQNGLDADIVYVRKNRKEQPAFGGFGKNGFAEQFVLRSSHLKKKKVRGVLKTVREWNSFTSANFDTAANFALMRMFFDSGSVQKFFIDKVLIREMFRHAEARKISKDPGVRAFLSSLKPAPSHADHFHVRLYCQATDTKCISAIAPRVRHVSTAKKKRVSR